MSSLIGHSLVGLMVGVTNQYPRFLKSRLSKLLWISWLIIVAIAPDFDYILPFFYPSSHEGIRITHSLFYCSVLPIITILVLKIARVDCKSLKNATLQLILASFSHLALDLLVGVTALPIFLPVSKSVFKLPFGILPSAGKPSLTNYYFYFNLGIEMGVLLPSSCCLLIIIKAQKIPPWRWVIIGLLLSVTAYFMHWAFGLSR